MSNKVRVEGDRLIIEAGGQIIVRDGGIILAEPGAIVEILNRIEAFDGTTFTLSPREQCVRTTSSSPVSIVVPPYSAVPFPPGTSRKVIQGGTGQVTFVAGDGVTILSSETLKIAKRNAAAVITATDLQDTWQLIGYLEKAT
ncbi:hypothetical protein EFV37_13170 [Mesorhizobium loti]|uniref:Uncharacterized protein n=1 Tax=Mesorhizobium jarvisii TaxID=1777867 RepID=A0A6M7TFP0_9HYPH|nr:MULTISPECIES: hypothetical protein [Mesorhizobium]OBQ58034.1 hypothetical protein A9K72_27910 [Mesorhizobium loti]QKC63146.1 hypothetical protein EB229_13160 [Mesorhizobium jarvisii]QKD09057.1 hypothetical protein EFV37_13170 [Mesorhizobium loti]RJT30153.1 hypothetical protein D3242_25895 [Mesorhizobium jarvisii]